MELKLLSDIGLNIVDVIVFVLFFISFTSQKTFIKKCKPKCIVFAALYIILCVIISVIVHEYFKIIIIMIISIPMFSHFSKTSLGSTLFVSAFTATYLILLYVLIFFIFLIALFVPPEVIIQNSGYLNVFLLTSKAVQLISAIIIYELNIRKFKINFNELRYDYYFIIIMQTFMIAVIIVGVCYGIGYDKNKQLSVIRLCILYILSVALSIFSVREREKMLKQVYRKQVLEEYVKNLENVIKVLRCEKHDFMNHLQTIYALCKLKKPNSIDSIIDYIKKLTSNYEESCNFYNTGNDYVDGLLAVKSHVCSENGIKLSVDMNEELSQADIDELNIAGIMGNILDNGIESILSLGNGHSKGKEIAIKTYIVNDQFYLSISNNGPQIPSEIIDNIFELGVTSKGGNSEHGYGLFITRQLVIKNNGDISVKSDSESTEFIVTLHVKKTLKLSDCLNQK